MTKENLKDLDAILRGKDKKYRPKLADRTHLSRPRVNVFFQGSLNKAIAEAIKNDLVVIKLEKEQLIQGIKTDIKQIQKMYESLNEV